MSLGLIATTRGDGMGGNPDMAEMVAGLTGSSALATRQLGMLEDVAAAMRRNDVDCALQGVRQQIAGAPHDWLAWQALGEILAATSDHAGAAAAFEQAATLRPDPEESLVKAARSHARHGEFQASAHAFARAGSGEVEPVWADFDPPGEVPFDRLWAGSRLFVRLTPDPRLPLNTEEYDEAYHLDTVIGHGRRFWAFGPPFTCTQEEGVVGFGYNADRRYLLKFGGPFTPGAAGYGFVYPGYFYKSLQFSLSSAAGPVWSSDSPGSLESIRDLVNDGRRFRVAVAFDDGWWSTFRANLVFCYRHIDRFDVRTGPIAYPDLFEMPHEFTAPYLVDFHDAAVALPGFNPVSDFIRTTMRVVDLTIRSDLTLEERTPTPFWSTRRIARLALFAD